MATVTQSKMKTNGYKPNNPMTKHLHVQDNGLDGKSIWFILCRPWISGRHKNIRANVFLKEVLQ